MYFMKPTEWNPKGKTGLVEPKRRFHLLLGVSPPL